MIKIGFELEAGWKDYEDNTWNILKEGGLIDFELVGDSSIHIPDIDGDRFELRSRVYKENELEAIKKDLDIIFPHIQKWNYSCGFHLHFSFSSDEIYWKFTDRETYGRIVSFLVHTFKGAKNRAKNNFCKTDLPTDGRAISCQMKDSGERYRAINYAWRKHRTIEIRLFPMAKKEKILEFITKTLAFIKELEKEKEKEKIEHQVVSGASENMLGKSTQSKTITLKKQLCSI